MAAEFSGSSVNNRSSETLSRQSSRRKPSLDRIRRVAAEVLESRICLSAVLPIPNITNTIPANDDGSTNAVSLAFPVNFFGSNYSQLYVNNNGNITFTAPLIQYTPDSLTTPGHLPEIAAFFADVDTRGTGSGLTTYGSTTAPFNFGGTEGIHNAFVVNYPNVGYFDTHTDKLNNFQLILIDRSDTGSGNFDIEFNYNQIQWETGDASNGFNGLGGGSDAVSVGYTNGTGQPGKFLQLRGSQSAGSLIDGGPDALISNSINSTVLGRYLFTVRNGIVSPLQPTAIISAANILTSAPSETITVTYKSLAGPLDTTTIDGTNLTITTPDGTTLPATVINEVVGDNGFLDTVTYSVAGPGGQFNLTNNGTYLIDVNPGSVQDTSGLGVVAALGAFTVGLPDANAPTAVFTAPLVTAANLTTDHITVVYTDNHVIRASTINPDNIIVTSQSGINLVVTKVSQSSNFNAQTITAVYTVNAPFGTFTAADTGIYTVSLNPATPVTDTSANPAIATPVTFPVRIHATPPDVTIVDSGVTTPGATNTIIDVIYHDVDSPLDVSTINSGNITVTAPDGTLLPVSLASITGGGNDVTAHYLVAAPGGAFTAANKGTYIVNVLAGTVKDSYANAVAATAGTLTVDFTRDATYGATTGGTVSLPFTVLYVLPLPNGQTIVAGHQGDVTGGNSQAVLERLNSDGTVDPLFGVNGVVTVPAGNNDAFYSAAVQLDGKVVAVGVRNGAIVITRYDANGTLDTTFGTNGSATANLPASVSPIASNVTVTPSGAIVVATQGGNGAIGLAKFTTAGVLDPTFNPTGASDATFPAGGQVTLATTGASNISQFIVEPNGKILGVGTSGSTVIAFLLNPDGSRDTSFGANGIVTLPQLVPTTSASPGVALQPGGNIIVSGEASGGGLGVVRLTPAGAVDTTFGTGGVAVAKFGGVNDLPGHVIVNPATGAIVVTGTTDATGVTQDAAAGFNPDGSVNTNFGVNGLSTFAAPIGATSTFASVQPDGRILLGSSNTVSADIRRVLAVAPASVEIGTIGSTRATRLAPFTLPNGTVVSIVLHGGSGTVFRVGSQVELDITGKTSVLVKTTGGTGTLSFSTVSINGNVRSFKAPTASIDGTLNFAGTTGSIILGNITGVLRTAGSIASLVAGNVSGTVSAGGSINRAKLGAVSGIIAAGQNIRSLSASSLADATILAGANLGADGQLAGIATDTFSTGQILSLKVNGAVVTSFIGAGVNPVDGVFGDGDDVSASPASLIKSITVKGSVDALTRFESHSFPKSVKLPAKINPLVDTRFKLL